MPEKIKAGMLGSPHGVRGWVRVCSYTDPRDNIFTYSPWWLKTGEHWKQIELEDARKQGRGLIAKLEGIDDCDAARDYTNCEIAIEPGQLPELEHNEFYWRDLVGLNVVNQDQVDFGKVSYLIETGANDVLVVTGDRQRLIPYTDQTILDVDLDSHTVSVDWDADF